MTKTTIILIAIITMLTSCSTTQKSKELTYHKESGFVFGTTYHITYRYTESLEDKMLERLKAYDNSLSTYNKNSIISKINRNEDVEVDTFFTHVFNKSLEFYQLSEHKFDITVAPLSKLWKFSSTHPDTITTATYDSICHKVDSVRQFIGLDKVRLVNGHIIKDDPRIQLEACALAEGYGIDVATSVFDEHGVTDYLIEIGGEMRIKGLNQNGHRWRIAIDKPEEGSNEFSRQVQSVIRVTDCAISTSGSYRQFYYTQDGQRMQHTIDPTTGRPVTHGMLSVTVIGPNTLTTDALSTTFMVIGPEKAFEMANKLDGIETYIIYTDEDKTVHELRTDGYTELIGAK